MRGCVVSGESSGGVHVFAPEDKVIVPYQGAGEDERVCYKVCTCTADELMTSCEDIGLCDLPEGCASSTQYYGKYFREHDAQIDVYAVIRQ